MVDLSLGGLLALLLTGWQRRYALAHRLLDIPNERSSHTVPTPAGGGGVSVVLTALALLTWMEAGFSLFSWLILLGVFIVDATVTLLRRVVRGERFYQAHRSHAYQYAPLIWLAVRFKAGARELQEV